jgi:crotonobetainyl-CoA:carnitine CoA-transferase CaiB-like acyl-CoA transferase
MMNALAGATPCAMGDDGFMHPAASSGPMQGTETGGEGTAAGAIHAAFFVAAALVQRDRTGQGAYIDVSGYEGVIAQGWIAATYALNEGKMSDRSSLPAAGESGGDAGSALYQFYECADGQALLFCCIEPKFWRNFCAAVDRPDLADANQGAGGPGVDFAVGRSDLRVELQRIFATRPLAEWVAMASDHDVALGPAYRSVVEAWQSDPHYAARGSLHTTVHPEIGEYTFVKEAGLVAGQPYSVRHHAPAFGQHSVEILSELGMDRSEIDALTTEGVVIALDSAAR